MAWLLDTNILSELRKPRPGPKVEAFIAAQPLGQLYISVVTLAEIRFGIELVGDASKRVAELGDWLTNKVGPMFERGSSRSPRTSCSNGGFWLKMAGKWDIRFLSPI